MAYIHKSAPAPRPISRSASFTFAVSMIMGTSEKMRISLQQVKPSLPGNITSSMTKLGEVFITSEITSKPSFKCVVVKT